MHYYLIICALAMQPNAPSYAICQPPSQIASLSECQHLAEHFTTLGEIAHCVAVTNFSLTVKS